MSLRERLEAIAEEHEKMAAHYRLIGSRSGIPEVAPISVSHMNLARLYRELADTFTQLEQEEKAKMKRKGFWTLITGVVMILSLVGPVSAQEATDVPTDAATLAPEETPVIVVTVVAPTDVPDTNPPPEETPNDDVRVPQAAFVIVIVVVGVLFSLFLVGIRSFAIELLKRLSPFLRPVVYTGVEAVLGELRRIARETADTADDEQIEKFVQEWERIKRDVDGTILSAQQSRRR